MRKHRKTNNLFVFWITLATVIIIGLIVILIMLINKDNEKPLKKEPISQTVQDNKDNIQPEEQKDLVNYDGLETDEILRKATEGIENYTYALYVNIESDWNTELTEENKKELAALGCTEDDLKGVLTQGIAGMVTPELESLNYINTVNLMGSEETIVSTSYFDYKHNKMYFMNTNLVSQTKEDDWTVQDIEDKYSLRFNDFISDLDFSESSIMSDELNYYITGTYLIGNENNNLNWVLYNLMLQYNVDLSLNIPVKITVSKETGKLSRLDYDFSIIHNTLIGGNYKITKAQLYYTFSNLNTTELQLPENLTTKKKDEARVTIDWENDAKTLDTKFIDTLNSSEEVNFAKYVLLPDVVNSGLPLREEYFGLSDLKEMDFIKMFNTWTLNRYSDIIVEDKNSAIYNGKTNIIIGVMLNILANHTEESLMQYITTELKYDSTYDIKETCAYALLTKIGFGEYNETYFNTYNNLGKTVQDIINDVKNIR